jgi:2-methylcitrate dehydratase PrpD
MGKALHPGKAAMDGLLAALLAQKGFTASESVVEDKNGFLEVLSAEPDLGLATRGLGVEWTVLRDGFKPYACASLTHPTIESVMELRGRHDLEGGDIESIEATVNGHVSWVTAKRNPTTGLEGKFSIYHCAAVAALDGRASLEQFTDDRVNDPQVAEMRKRVRIIVDESLPKDAARVTLKLNDGRQLQCAVEHNKGTPDRPMTDSEVEAKFLDLAGPRLGNRAARDVVGCCWNLESRDDAGEIARRCRGESSSTSPIRGHGTTV